MPKKIHRRRDADPREGAAKYGKATFADPVNKKYPIDTPGQSPAFAGCALVTRRRIGAEATV
jgi:hypothetical protein